MRYPLQVKTSVVSVTKKNVRMLQEQLLQYLDVNGYVSWSEKKRKYIILGSNRPKNGLAECPECKMGMLMIIRSKVTRKRFMGCSNYYSGCRASSPLIQRAKLRGLKQKCQVCMWPMVLYRYSRKQKWSRQCSNFFCKSRVKHEK